MRSRSRRRPQRGPHPVAAVITASLIAGSLTLWSPIAAAAPCDPWPPTGDGTGSSTGSLSGSQGGSLGAPSTPATPWHDGGSGYIPILKGLTTTVELLTGPTSPNDTVDRFGISGTDLGILWDNGASGNDRRIMMALGDTMGDCSVDGDEWRSNILFRSSDRELSDGMRINDAPMEREGMAKSILPRSSLPGEFTVIPTAGIEVGGKQYLRYMSVASWDEPGEWTTNYSALAKSEDNGENWAPVAGSGRIGEGNAALVPENVGTPYVTQPTGQMSAFLKHTDGGVDYVYEYMTPSGRSGSAKLARVPAAQIEDMGAYRFWDGSTWVADHADARVVLDGQVSELSVTWSARLGRFIALYTDENNNIVMRQASTPEGPWSGKDILLSYQHVPTLYGAFAHPWSPAVESNGKDLYFTMSTWDAYNVFLMKTDLSKLQTRRPPDPNSRMRTADDSWTRDTPDPADTGETVLVDTIPIPEG
ncbi:DUF4185 domain-containing protein [Dietzia sp. ANT_WB102]|uniref:DUF4185 domain-containing protein n=1 Tax=Dietzia sp. ANT_WB102 TaxID=2597345 RepID=UPI00210807DB|nr:DUF4185 domain-containing protein [Dietzia sp. ANT_WB102]